MAINLPTPKPFDPVGLVWPKPLFPYQQDGVERLLAEPSLLLADEMGLGKTIQAIAALRVLKPNFLLSNR